MIQHVVMIKTALSKHEGAGQALWYDLLSAFVHIVLDVRLG